MKLRALVAAAGVVALSLALAGAGLSTSSFSPRQGGIAGIVPPVGTGVHQFDTPQGSGDLTYHGGPVMRTNTTYAIYWLPSGYSYNSNDANYESTINQFFTDVAHDSGLSSNVYAATPQYYDTVGGGTHHIAYTSSFGGSVVVTDALPASSECDNTAYTSFCVLDSTLRAEIKKTVEAQGWPEDTSHMYFLFTPPDIGSCFDSSDCSYSQYCAYHSAFSGASGTIVYANQPWTKGMDCEVGQYPNGSDADPTINVVSHEHNEAITDPTLSAWWDAAGYENGDKCAWGFGPESGTAGAQYNQTINGHHYLLQEEYDNSTSSCIQATAASAPSITSFTPTSGPTGTSVTLTGSGFTGATGVSFNGTPATTYSVVSDTSVTATVPDGATSGTISVTNGAGTGTTSGSFTVTPPVPTVDSFTPSADPIGGSVTIGGTNLTGATSVAFGGTDAPDFTVDSDTQITATVPAGAKTGTISVTTPGGTATSTDSFTPIAITSFSPAHGKPGTTVTITGSGLLGALSVSFGGVAATTFTVVSATKVTAKVAAGTGTGPVSVDTLGGTATSTADWQPFPQIDSFTPTRGPGGTVFTITGLGFTGATSVKFNGKPAVAYNVDSDTQLTATLPGSASSGKIGVATPGGTVLSSQLFDIVAIKAVAPAKGKAGTKVTITGSGFANTTDVQFDGMSAASFTVVSDKKVTAVVPAGAVHGFVDVVTSDGQAESPKEFAIVPAITGLTVSRAAAGGSVGITGSGFTDATAVKFGSKTATFTVDDDGDITATVPAGATTGKVSVVGPGGTATSRVTLTIITVRSFTPTTGKTGSTVTIVGTGLGGATAVSVGAVGMPFTQVSATKITATAPGCPTSGQISVTTPDGTATSAGTYTVVTGATC